MSAISEKELIVKFGRNAKGGRQIEVLFDGKPADAVITLKQGDLAVAEIITETEVIQTFNVGFQDVSN